MFDVDSIHQELLSGQFYMSPDFKRWDTTSDTKMCGMDPTVAIPNPSLLLYRKEFWKSIVWKLEVRFCNIT